MQISSTKSIASGPIKLVIAGEPGVGKTSLAASIQRTLGEKVLVISAEAGLLSLASTGEDVDYIELQHKDGKPVSKTDRIKHLYEVLLHLATPEMKAKYQWIFIDSITEIQQNMLDTLEANPEFAGPKNTMKKFGELANKMMSLCKSFRDISHYNVVFSCLIKTETDADNQSQVRLGLVGSLAEKLPALFDEIFYMTVTKDLDSEGRNVRKILTGRTDKISFPKDRSGKLLKIESDNLGAIIKKIRSQNNAQNKQEK